MKLTEIKTLKEDRPLGVPANPHAANHKDERVEFDGIDLDLKEEGDYLPFDRVQIHFYIDSLDGQPSIQGVYAYDQENTRGQWIDVTDKITSDCERKLEQRLTQHIANARHQDKMDRGEDEYHDREAFRKAW